MFEFTAFAGIANLQSTLNDDDNLGTTSLAFIYGALVVSSILLPTFTIEKLGLKYTLMLSLVCYVTYTAANFYPQYYTLIPTAIILGLAGAPLWSAKCAYVTTAAQKYSRISGEKEEAVVTRFFGIFFMFFQLTQLFGNLISSLILSDITTDGVAFKAVHNTTYISRYCGANDCNDIDFKVPVRISGLVDKIIYSGVFCNLEQFSGMKVRLILSESSCNISPPPRPVFPWVPLEERSNQWDFRGF